MIAILQCPNCNEQRHADSSRVGVEHEQAFHAWIFEWLRKHGTCRRRGAL